MSSPWWGSAGRADRGRVRAGIHRPAVRGAGGPAAVRARGRHTGRPPKLSGGQVRQARALRAGGESIGELVAGIGVFRATVYRALDPARPAGNPPGDGTDTPADAGPADRAASARWASGTSRWCRPRPRPPGLPGAAVMIAVSGRLLPPRPVAAHPGTGRGTGKVSGRRTPGTVRARPACWFRARRRWWSRSLRLLGRRRRPCGGGLLLW